MKVIISESQYDKDDIVDYPLDVAEKEYIFYIGAREGQLTRVKNKNIVACGYWSLNKAGFLDKCGRIIPETFKEFDCIVFAHPRRVYKPLRAIYEQFIKAIQDL